MKIQDQLTANSYQLTSHAFLLLPIPNLKLMLEPYKEKGGQPKPTALYIFFHLKIEH